MRIRFYRSRWFKILFLAALLLLCYGGGRLFFRLTDGFYSRAVTIDYPYEKQWESVGDRLTSGTHLDEILSQPFTYYTKGTQSYVFLSGDGRYILKIFKAKHLNIPYWLHSLETLPLAGEFIAAKRLRRYEKRCKLFNGYRMALSQLPSSGILYCHFNPTKDRALPLKITDKMGVERNYDPNTLAFCIQKRGIPLKEAFLRFRDQQRGEEAKIAMRSIFSYLVQRSQLNLYDCDPAYTQNLGFIDGEATNLDVGNLLWDPQAGQHEMMVERLTSHLFPLRNWLEINYPQMVEEYDRELAKLREGD